MARKRPARIGLDDGVSILRERYRGRLKRPMEGLAYRFTIWLPVQSRGQPIFSEVQRFAIRDLLMDCFGGYSESRLEGFPPWSGSWLPEGGGEPVVDLHIQLIAYTLQDNEATGCMRQLKWLLQQKHIAAQEVVLIEQVPVQFVEAEQLSG